MSNSTGPNLGLFINGNLGEGHYEILMKQFRGFDGLIQCHVLDKDLAEPPAGVVDGHMYIIPANATGVWAGRTGQIARGYTLGTGAPAWEFFVPKKGWSCLVEDEGDVDGVPLEYRFTGTQWRKPAAPDATAMQNPMTTPGDVIIAGEGGEPIRLPIGAEGMVLKIIGGQVLWGEDATQAGAAGMVNPMTSIGDMIRGGVDGQPARVERGDNGQFLGLEGGVPTWLDAPGASDGMDNPMTDEGDLIVGGDSGVPVRLARGAEGTALRIVAGVLAWVAEGAALTNPMTTLGDIIVGADAGVPQRLGIGTEGQVLKAIGGELQWGDESGGGGGMTNPMTTLGDIIVAGAGGTPTRLPKGADGQVLKMVTGALAWAADVAGMTNPMTTAGDIIVAGAAGAPTRLGKGADGQVLKMVAGVLAWAAESGGGGGMVNPMTAEGDIIVGGPAGTPARLSKGSDGQVLKMVAGALAWAADAAGMTNPMTSAGDIIIGGTAGAPARLGKGSDGQVLKTVAGVLTWAAESGGGSGPANTDALAEGTANLYFTTARVLATALTGLVTNNATVVSATDTLLVAVGKLQAQVQARLQLSGGKMTGAINQATPVTVASAATVNIGATASETINITGTTTITAFDTIAAGARRRLVFGGTLTLAHGPSSLILPGYANITTEVGDSADFESMGGGNWKCTAYNRVNGRPIAVGAPIPSITAANNVNIYAAGVGVVSITGTTGIGYVGTGVEGQEVTVVFTGATPLYHSASLVLPGGDNVTTAAGDIAKFLFTGATGVTRCTMYTRAAEGVGAELITNANGIAMKFPDGTMICQIFGIATPAVSAGGPNIFISNTYTWTLPAAFSNTNFTVSGGSKVLNRWTLGQPATAGTATLRDVCYSSVAAATADLIAIGRWK